VCVEFVLKHEPILNDLVFHYTLNVLGFETFKFNSNFINVHNFLVTKFRKTIICAIVNNNDIMCPVDCNYIKIYIAYY